MGRSDLWAKIRMQAYEAGFQRGLANAAAAAGDVALRHDLMTTRENWVDPEGTNAVVAASMGVSPEALRAYNERMRRALNPFDTFLLDLNKFE
ncbi:hypothetical protein IRY61_03760 [Candidatus Saccharibacteria bacterium]|jgi:hypothetical protein|nr:hypothetical protein [Candidatus Saccharibacteria bacterium]